MSSFLKRALMMELSIYASIARFVARVPIIDLVVHPWPAVRIPFLVLGV